VTLATPKFAAQAIRKIYDIGWKPTHFLTSVSNSVGTVMKNAGTEKGVGIISAAFAKDPTDPQWADTPEYKDWLAFMKKYNASANLADVQAASLHDVKMPMLLPGITLSTSATDFAPVKQMQLEKFDGTTWKLFGEVISASGS